MGSTGIVTDNLLKRHTVEYFGKYRGIVTNIDDPSNRGRLKAQIPKVLGKYDSNWALPAFTPGTYIIPKEGTGVWIEFEEGNPEKPIWSGIWLAEEETMEEVVKTGITYNPETNVLEIFGDNELKIFLGGEGEGIPLGATLKTWLDNHTHGYSWTDSGGSGNTSSPNNDSPSPSEAIKIRE